MIRVMIVDDEPLARENLRMLLGNDRMYELVGEYASGKEALEGCGQQAPQIVLTDVSMSEMDGLELIREMKQVLKEPVVFVIISGYDTFEYARGALNLGVCEYLLKPVFAEEFEETMESAVRRLRTLEKERRLGGLEEEAQRNREENEGQEREADIEWKEESHALCEELAEELMALNTGRVKDVGEQLLQRIQEKNCEVQEEAIMNVIRLFEQKAGITDDSILKYWSQEQEENFFERCSNLAEECMFWLMEEKNRCNDEPTLYIQLYIRKNYASDCSVRLFAQRLHRNTAYLGQKFIAAAGCSINDYVNEIRFREAKKLMDRKQAYTVKDVMEQVGFKNYASFSRIFAEKCGCLPSEYVPLWKETSRS